MTVNQKNSHVSISFFGFIYWLIISTNIYGQADSLINLIPGRAVCCDETLVKSEFVFSPENSLTSSCHASTIEEINGGFITAWFGGTREGDKDVGIWISRNTKGKWSKPVEIVNGLQGPGIRYPCWNPVLFKPDFGPLILFYKVGPGPQQWWGMMVTSDDEGQTWSAPHELGCSTHGKLIGPAKNKPVESGNGIIICPTSIEYQDESGDLFWRVFFEISLDNGKSWEATDYINDGVDFDAIQPCILSHSENRLQTLCRSKQNVITQCWSVDGGITWGEMTGTDVPNPDSGIDAVTLADGRHVLVYNHTKSKSGFPEGRNMLNIAISEDGTEWKPVMTLERQNGEYSYPAVIQSSDGYLHVTYTYQRKAIKHMVINPEKLFER